MYQIDVPSAALALPAPAAAGTAGYFTDGDVVSGQEATVLPADFVNAVMIELLNVVTAAGIAPSKTIRTQVRDALATLYPPKPSAIAGLGQIVSAPIIAGAGGQITLPPGGTWAYFYYNVDTGACGVAAGGTVVFSGLVNNQASFCWRIA